MQEALIKTYRYVGRIREPEAFRPWLYRTVRNACLMGRRKRAGEPARLQSLDELLPGPHGPTRPDAPHPGKNPEQLADNAGSVVACGRRSRALPASLPRHRVPSRDGRAVDARGREGDGDFGGQRQDSPAPGSSPAPGGSGEGREMTVPGPSVRAVPRPVAGVVALSGRRPDACPSSNGRAAHPGVHVLRDDGRTLADDGGRLPRRREEATAPRRDVARSGADQGAGRARPSRARLRLNRAAARGPMRRIRPAPCPARRAAGVRIGALESSLRTCTFVPSATTPGMSGATVSTAGAGGCGAVQSVNSRDRAPRARATTAWSC